MKYQLKPGYTYKPLTADNWDDFEALMGEKGGSAGCWCMWNRLEKNEFEKNRGIGNKEKMRDIVEKEIPGLILYYDNIPIGWLSMIYRDKATALNRSRVLKSIDDLKVCSIVCIYIPRKYAGKGATEQILIALIDFAKLNGIKILEAYPVDSNGKKTIASFVYTGFYSTYIRLGFVEIIRRSTSKPILRYSIESN